MEGPKDHDSYIYIQRKVESFYSSGGEVRTKEEVLDCIRYFREKYWFLPGPGWSKKSRQYRIILRFMSYEISKVIRESKLNDPIEILYTYSNWVEDIFTDSEAVGNTTMTFYILEAVREILEYLR